MEKLPVFEKIYEAWTAVADRRITLLPDSNADRGSAVCSSSDSKKSYDISWTDNGTLFRSTDNATYWRGYPGYPIIAVLMMLGRIPYNEEMAKRFAGVDWKAVNTRHKNRYSEAVAEVEDERGINPEEAAAAAQEAFTALERLHIRVTRKAII